MNTFPLTTVFILTILGLLAVAGLICGTLMYRRRVATGFYEKFAVPQERPVRERRPGDPQNTLQQDLYLLSKGRYKTASSMVDAARTICAFHILMPTSSFTIKDTNFWMFKEFVETGIILKDTKKLTRFLLDLGGHFSWLTLESSSPQMEYHFNLLHGLLSELRMTQVYEGDKLLLPFEIPPTDPKLEELLLPAEQKEVAEAI